MTQADKNFIDTVNLILEQGVSTEGYKVRPKWPSDGTPAHSIKVSNVVNRYDVSKELPIMTLRKVPAANAIDEILWIWQKKSNDTALLKSRIWDAWADENGTIGRAYGYQLGRPSLYKMEDGVMRAFDQVDRILWCLTNDPMDRRMIADMFKHEDLHLMGLAPCCHHVNLNVVGDRIDMLLKQRSQDMAVANGWNVFQYAILLHMFARHSGLKPGVLTHVIADCHIYDRHIEGIKELISRPTYDAPQLIINPDVKNFYDFRVEDFVIENYQHGPFIKFEVAE